MWSACPESMPYTAEQLEEIHAGLRREERKQAYLEWLAKIARRREAPLGQRSTFTGLVEERKQQLLEEEMAAVVGR